MGSMVMGQSFPSVAASRRIKSVTNLGGSLCCCCGCGLTDGPTDGLTGGLCC
jgi:hypothetical protein